MDDAPSPGVRLLARLELRRVRGGSLTSRHADPFTPLPLPPGSAHKPRPSAKCFRCAFGPPGNASCVRKVPHIQAHQPLQAAGEAALDALAITEVRLCPAWKCHGERGSTHIQARQFCPPQVRLGVWIMYPCIIDAYLAPI